MRGQQFHHATHPPAILIATFNARIFTSVIPKNVTKMKTGVTNSLY